MLTPYIPAEEEEAVRYGLSERMRAYTITGIHVGRSSSL